jgi:hypothetical protein
LGVNRVRQGFPQVDCARNRAAATAPASAASRSSRTGESATAAAPSAHGEKAYESKIARQGDRREIYAGRAYVQEEVEAALRID